VRRTVASLVAVGVIVGAAPAFAEGPAAACVYLPEDADALAARGLVLAAEEKYRACVASCDGDARSMCEARLAALDKQVPRLRVVVRDKNGKPVADAQVTIDGVDAKAALSVPQALDPGTHRVRVISAHVRGEQKLVLALGDTEKTVAFDEPQPIDPNGEAPDGQHAHGAGPWIVIGVGFVAIFSGIILSGAGTVASDRAGNPDDSLRDPGIGLVLGGLATVAGGLLWHYLEPRTAPKKTSAAGAWLTF